MSYTKIAPIVLYVILIITVLIMILFFAGNSLVEKNQFESKVKKIENSSGITKGPSVISDLQSADSLSAAQSAQTFSITEEKTEKVQLSFVEKIVYFKTDIALIWGYLLLIISAAVTLIFPIIYIFLHPTNLIRSLLVLAGVAVLVGLAFMVAPGNAIEIPGYTGDINTKAFTLKLIDTGLIFSYFILGLTLLSIVLSEIVLYFK